MSILSKIQGPEDVKKLSKQDLKILADEIRGEIVSVTSKNGGHVGPNLGVVELCIALHRVFSTPKDKIVFDVSHQSYVHKLLTGRNGEKFRKLRQSGGYCGFCNRSESEHDAFGAGHAGTALSAALGLAAARDMLGGDENVIAVLGDAALTNGISFEALNNIESTTKKFILVLNDNKMSISKNVGALSKYFNDLITNPVYTRLYSDMSSFLKKSAVGRAVKNFGSKVMSETKDFFMESSTMFEKYGLRYLGPIDGHNIEQLEMYLNFCKNSPEPVILHIVTEKGRGLPCALKNPEKFHGASPYNVITGENTEHSDPTVPLYQDAMGKTLLKIARKDSTVVGITAAMSAGTGLCHIKKELPEQFFDVGIAEEHAAVFSAGLAARGIKPVAAIYSSFMQRAVDCAMHDVCLQNLPVTFCMDRAGLSAQDGATHHGLFDIAMLRCLPNATIMQPSNEDELADMLYTSVYSGKPCFIRYPRGKGEGVKMKEFPQKLEIGKAEVLSEGADVAIWALGNMVGVAKKVAEILKEKGISAGVVNARFAKPLDENLLREQAGKAKIVATLEDHSVRGGFGSAVAEFASENNMGIHIEIIGWKDEFIPHGSSVGVLREMYGLTPEAVAERIGLALKSAE
ncbi:MAG: 1-deoxy-D-xylulose-5-phosphate synthase [Opitutales bacterium]|nr:1-deoxy-D-xylulose-5-phosphate synthase [Opitutales bacterium]